MEMNGRTAIVTGAGRDIGRACALRFAELGANVGLNYFQSGEGAESAVAEIKANGGNAFCMQGDMTKPADVAAFVDTAVQNFGGLDYLIPVTGGLIARRAIPEITAEHWQAVMDLNVTSLLLLVQISLPHMNGEGAIVTLASQAGRDGGGPGALAYGAAKGAVMTMTRGMAKQLSPGIRVNSVCPGMIDTDFHNIFTKPEVRSMVANNTPLKREGSSEEVADLVAYLASDRASFVNGANVDVNGGILFS